MPIRDLSGMLSFFYPSINQRHPNNTDKHHNGTIPNFKKKLLVDSKTIERARKIAPGYDLYMIENEWIIWNKEKGIDSPRCQRSHISAFCSLVK